MKRKLLILYSKNPNEVFNRKSALGSYIHSLSTLLFSEFEVYINGEILELGNISYQDVEINASTGVKGMLKSFIPAIVKHTLLDIQLFNNVNDLEKNLEDNNYDVILEFYSYSSNIGCNISKKQNIPLYVIYDGPLVEEYEFFNGHRPVFFKKIIGRHNDTLEQAKGIVVYSEPVKEFLIKEYKIDDKFYFHQNIDFSRFEFLDNPKDNDSINICFIGSFLKWHRVDLLINSFTRLREKDNLLKLYLIGAGQEFDSIKSLVVNNKFVDDIILTGYKDGEELRNLKKKMHIGVMPSSNWYGAPNKIFEYGASRMAVVAPSTPTVKYIFTEDTVSFFENNSEQELFDSLSSLVSDTDIIIRKSIALNSYIKETYSEKHTLDFYLGLLKSDYN